MKHGNSRRTRLLRCCQIAQFLAGAYVKKLERSLSQYIGPGRRKGFRIVLSQSIDNCEICDEEALWIDIRYAFLSDRWKYVKIVEKQRDREKATICHVKVRPVLCDAHVAFMGALCAFNLSRRGVCLENAQVQVLDEEDICNTPSISSRAYAALIVTPFCDTNADYSTELRRFFRTPKFVSTGDVIAVRESRLFARKMGHVFFKIVHLDGINEQLSEAVIDSRQTSLFQVENIYDKIPYSDIQCYVPEKYAELAQRIGSLISAKSSMKWESPPVFLLSGLPGCGKKLLLKQISSVTHLNVLFYDCLSLWNDTSGTFEGKIHAAFQNGSRYEEFGMLAFLNADLFGYDPNSIDYDARVLGVLKRRLKTCTSAAVFLVCNSGKIPGLPTSLRFLATYHFEVPLLDVKNRESVIAHQLTDATNRVDTGLIARHTNGFTLSELHTLYRDALYRKHTTNSPVLVTDHFSWAIDVRNIALADNVDAPSVSYSGAGFASHGLI